MKKISKKYLLFGNEPSIENRLGIEIRNIISIFIESFPYII